MNAVISSFKLWMREIPHFSGEGHSFRSGRAVVIVGLQFPCLARCRCPDLEEYIREVDEKKQMLILVNKSDFLTDEFRY